MENAVLTGLGLAPSAGLNAYIPLLIFALADRFTDRVTLDRPYDFISSTPGIAILLVLLSIELIADKVPGIDHANDLIQSAIRPGAGGILMMASTNQGDALNPVVAMIVGLLLAGGVHGVKATTRPAITVSTGGVGNPVISMIEDGIAAIVSIMAILVPIAAIALLIILGLLLWWLYRKIRHFTSFLARSSKPGNATTLR
ncbi:MAG: hypothetical protein QOG89_360 [Thermomicrobiales bacterium]|nr:hypothetical protein [Thermomicrobiales bacterium]